MTVPSVLNEPLAPHPLRSAVLGEVHARPFHAITTPRRVLHFAFVMDGAATQAARIALGTFCAQRGLDGPPEGAKHFRAVMGSTILRWESHAEFATYTWEFSTQGHGAFDPPAGTLASAMAALPQPGPHLVSVDLHLLPATFDLTLDHLFDSASLTASLADDEGALVAMDFRADAGGFVRILVQDIALTPIRAGALVQRVLEIETYRLLALLGLPEAQRLTPKVQAIEIRLAEFATQMTTTSGLDGDHRLLEELMGLLAELEAESVRWTYRYGATRAYDGIVQQRLETIGERPQAGWPSISAFLARRMAPAMRTAQMLDARQTDLARKLVRAANLLRTRVDVEIEQQNRDLLRSMNERTQMQLRLQQTVEGLSVAAISYYIVGLASYLFKGLKDARWLGVEPEVASAIVVPVAVVAVALVVRRIRNRHAD